MLNKKILIGIAIIAVACSGIYAYYCYSEQFPTTDNAYIGANLVNVSPKVSGFIDKIYVQNNQLVHKGDLLLTIQPQDYLLQSDKAQQNIALLKQQEAHSINLVANAEANVKKVNGDMQLSMIMAQRYLKLYQDGAGSLQDMQKFLNQAEQAKQALLQGNIALAQAKEEVKSAELQTAIANLDLQNANNNKNYTLVRATADGFITNLNLAAGQLIQSGQILFGIVDNSIWWVDANYKETQISRIHAGQKATVVLDMYKHKYHGTVDSISRASGNTFSLLPAQNATGNWIKVTQRFTVKIKIPDDRSYPLRVGASAIVTVDTTTHHK